MADRLFRDRREAGRVLARLMDRYRGRPDVVVPGLPRAASTVPRAAAVRVIYRPDTERQSHCFRARVADRSDAVIHLDETRALEPLERTARWEQGEVPETYPFTV